MNNFEVQQIKHIFRVWLYNSFIDVSIYLNNTYFQKYYFFPRNVQNIIIFMTSFLATYFKNMYVCIRFWAKNVLLVLQKRV